MRHLFVSTGWLTRALFSLCTLLLGSSPLLAQPNSEEATAVTPFAPALTPQSHEWMQYAALGLGLLNMVLLYMLYRSPNRNGELGSAGTEGGSSSSRTEKRMEKRKREIDELRHQVDELTIKLTNEINTRLTPAQVNELVRALVHDELTRSATPNHPAR